jgi:YbbR domain-containing protein
MKKKIFNNIGLKILALLIAIIVWWVVMNIDDPLVKKTISGINVELRNDDDLTDRGYIYEVDSGSVITITVRAPESVAKDLKASDFVAYADLSQLSPLTDSANITIECIKSDVKSDIKEITSKVQVVKLNIDNKETEEIPITINITGSPADNYVLGDSSISQNKIEVTGAASVIEKIASAVISYDVSNMMQSVSEMVTPVFYDGDGNVIDSSSLQQKQLKA